MKLYKCLLAAAAVLSLLMPQTRLEVQATEPADQAAPTEAAETPDQKAEREAAEMPVETNDLKGWPQGPATRGEAAIVMEAGTGAILYAKNIDAQEYPASITKVLTALVALEQGQLTDPVSLSHECVSFLQPGDSSVGLKEGNTITLEQALYATLLASANEGAYAVAENVGKNAGHDYNWFIEQMNSRCKELGGIDSNFVNANGLHDVNHYTSARDMALIGCELFKYPEYFKITQTLNYQIPASETTEEHVFQQKHKMLIPGNENYYEYAVAGKTGYTSDALSTLITMADNGEMKLVCVVLRTHGAKNIYPDTRNLFEYAFQNFKKVKVSGLEKSADVGEIIDNDSNGYVVLPEGLDFDKLEMKISVKKGQTKEADLAYTYRGNPVGSAQAKPSKSYVEEHSVQIKDPSSKKGEDEDKKMLRKTIEATAAVAVVCTGVFVYHSRVVAVKRRRRRNSRRK